LARALRGTGLEVQAVELPGHDIAAEREPFAPLDEIVTRVVDEIVHLGPAGLMLWGHSAGAAYAVAAAKALARRGVDVRRVFVGAQLLGDAGSRLAAADELSTLGTAEIAARLIGDRGYTELGDLDAARADHVGEAYRHDCLSAHRYLAQVLGSPAGSGLAVPVTVVVAADDPATAGYADRFGEWRQLADRVDLYELPDGGHYFLRTRPDDTARAVLHAVAAVS
jgi:surfactin synthase thioesterase subunit